ncbi:MAG: response regulator [Acidobacteriota bacterium]
MRQRPEKPGLLRFKQRIQIHRAVVYLFSTVIVVFFHEVGWMKADLKQGFPAVAIALLSALFFYLFYEKHWRLRIEPAWILLDSILITWAVAFTGGADSPWFPWYLASVSAAAFVMGIWWAAAFMVLDTIGYLGVLTYLGVIRSFHKEFIHNFLLVSNLFFASFFVLWAVTALQKKRELIKKMKEDESRKVEELTRLTTALDQRTRDLSRANLKIVQADRMKTQFLANMSHELRTPLNSIIGFSEVLLTRLEEEISPRYLRFLQNINTSGEHLLGVVNDLLDLSKIEAGKMEVNPERLSIESAVQGVCTIMKEPAGKRSIELAVQCDADLPPLEADPVKIKQILYNLLSNAVKFSPDGSTVSVSARFLPSSESILGKDVVEVAVSDQGIGIDPQDHERIFGEFIQVDSEAGRRFEGTGLGLALVRKLVEIHGGTIRLQSAPGQGSTFRVELPLAFSGAPGPAPNSSRPASSREPQTANTVLIVEDDTTGYEVIASHLSGSEYLTVRARLGEEGVRMARTLKPAAITLDLILPDLDGFQLLKRLKQDPETRDIPVIIVSLVEKRELALALGAEDYFVKPVDGPRLVGRLRELAPPAFPDIPVLLIDDDRQVHDLLDEVLAERGYRTLHAYAGGEGLEMARNHSPRLVVLDLLMEGMDGFKVAAELKEDSRTKDLPVLVLTAANLSEKDRSRLSGKINAMVNKDGRYHARLLQTIDRLVRRSPGVTADVEQ